MRIIGGDQRGRRINPPSKMPYTRPTTDIAKEGLFNTLQHLVDFEDAHCLDLFGGTGSISYEVCSRGAERVVTIERDRNMYQFIKKTADEFGFSEQMSLIQIDVFKFLESHQGKYDFIFAGPPYALKEIDLIPDIIIKKGLLNNEGVFVLEHTPRNDYEQHPNFFKLKNYGTTLFSFFKKNI